MRIRMNDSRERLYDRLEESAESNTKSGALDEAAQFYVDMVEEDEGYHVGVITDLLEAAEDRGSLTGEEIVEILDTDTVPLEYSTSWTIGDD